MARIARATAVVAKTRVGTGRNAARPTTRVVVDAAASFGTTNSRRVSSWRRTRVASRLGSSAARDAEAAAEMDERGAEGATPAMNAEVEATPVVAAMTDAASVAPEVDPTVDGAEEAEPTPTPTPASDQTRTGNVEDLLSRTRGGPPLFFSPSSGDLTLAPPDVSKPLMLYVPGLDGTGFAASPQFDRLERSFDLKAMHVPPTDRSDFETLVETIATFLEEETTRREAAGEKPRPASSSAAAKKGKKKKFQRDGSVYLLGESMGGLLSLGLALRRPDLVDRLVLVNPASSFDRSPWPSVGPLLPSLPEEIYGGVPYALAPVLFEPAALITGGLDAVARAAKASGLAVDGPFGVPVPDVGKIVSNGVVGADAFGDSIAALVDALGSQFPTLGALTAVIPRDTLAHRLSVLAAGCEVVNAPGALRSIDVPALCVASSEDLLIPSGDEGPRLRREMPRCRVEVLEGASHAALQKDECDLLEVMARNGFKPRAEQDPPPLSNDEGFMPPSAAELERAFESLEPLRRITSPVFFSTKANGQIVRGIDAVPLGTKGAPVLLVGNHQTLAPDLGFLVQEFIRERGTLVRGLAHPVVAGGGARAATKATEEEEKKRKEDEEKKEKAVNEGDGGSNAFPFPFPDLRELVERDWSGGGAPGGGGAGPFGEGGAPGGGPGGGPGGVGMFTTFGAVPVSGMNFYRLLDAGETVLLFPGGVREAFKRKNEEYKLFWPSKPEFVRMAVRHGAVIVPFAAVGAEDCVDIVADADDIARLPFGLGEAAIERSRAVPSARAVDTRVTDDGVGEETFVQPLVVPKTPRRYYFKFGAPVYTAGLRATGFAEDDEAVQAMYDGVKADVEDGVDWLLRRRREDPFGDTAYRVLYEAASGKPAGTFYADENVETRA